MFEEVLTNPLIQKMIFHELLNLMRLTILYKLFIKSLDLTDHNQLEIQYFKIILCFKGFEDELREK